MMWDHTRWRVTRKTLPSGRVVDIVVAKEPERPAPPIDLTLCPGTDCAGTMVFPVRWSEIENDAWCLVRRCPDCNRWWHGHHSHENVERFDEKLKLGTDELITSLEQVQRRNMAEWGARLVSALNHDALLPCDF